MEVEEKRIMVYSSDIGVQYYDYLSQVPEFSDCSNQSFKNSIHESELGLPRNTLKLYCNKKTEDFKKDSGEIRTKRTDLNESGEIRAKRTDLNESGEIRAKRTDLNESEETRTKRIDLNELDYNSLRTVPPENHEENRRGLRWVDIVGIDQKEVLILERALNLHPLTSEDIILTDTREKCETFQHYCLTCLRFLDGEAFKLGTLSHRLYIILLDYQLVSISTKASLNRFTIFRRIEQLNQGGISLTPDWISYLVMDEVVDTFVPMIRYIEVSVESLDDLSSILKCNDMTDMMLRISEVRKKTNHLLKNLNGKSGVVKSLMNRAAEKSKRNAELKLYFADVREQVISSLQDLMYFERTLARARKNYLAQILIEITHSSQKVNDAAMRMTTIACITFPLNVITGLFGMNVAVPGQDIQDLWWFFGIIGCMAIITMFMYYYARSKNVI